MTKVTSPHAWLRKGCLNGELGFTPTCQREVYDFQIEAMENYLDILADRAEIEKIEI